MEENIIKIYLTAFPITLIYGGMYEDSRVCNDVVWVSVSEDSVLVSSGISSSIDWAKNDSGFQSREVYRQDDYRKLFPDGYELIWVDTEDAKCHDILSHLVDIQ